MVFSRTISAAARGPRRRGDCNPSPGGEATGREAEAVASGPRLVIMSRAREDPMSKTTALAVAAMRAVVLAAGCRQPRAETPSPSPLVFNVKDFGATGIKDDLAQEAIQKAVDACAAAGGGTVFIPPGQYTSGTIHLRSHVRLFVEAGATVYSLHDKSRFDKDALLYGEDLVDVDHRRPRRLRRRRRLRPAPQGRPRGRFHPSEPGRDGEARPAAHALLPQARPDGQDGPPCPLHGRPHRGRLVRRLPVLDHAPRPVRARWSSTASISGRASRTASGPTASIPTAARTSASPTAPSRRATTPSSSIPWTGSARPSRARTSP